MKEEDMKAFADRLIRKKSVTTDEEMTGSKEEQILSEFWDDLGELKEEHPRNRKLVSEFQDKLDAYRDGWEASQIAAGKGSVSLEKSSGWVSRALPYAAAACVALVIFASGAFSGKALRNDDDLRTELSQTRETLALSLLHQSSASKQLAGLSEAAKVSSPSPVLYRAIVDALSYDANVNVRLAAVNTLCECAEDNVFEILINRLGEEKSPLVQLDIVNFVLQVGAEADRLALIEKLKELKVEPRVQRYFEKAKARINI